MSSFICEHCGTAIIDSDTGYVTGCEHYPVECRSKCKPGELCSCAWLVSDNPTKIDVSGDAV